MLLYHDAFSNLYGAWALFITCASIGLYLWYGRHVSGDRKRFPPGPRRLPILGSLLEMPTDKQWLAFERWGKEHGELRLALF